MFLLCAAYKETMSSIFLVSVFISKNLTILLNFASVKQIKNPVAGVSSLI